MFTGVVFLFSNSTGNLIYLRLIILDFFYDFFNYYCIRINSRRKHDDKEVKMKYYKITFDTGQIIKTGFNGTLKSAENYYLNNLFELDEEKPMAKAVKVEEIE